MIGWVFFFNFFLFFLNIVFHRLFFKEEKIEKNSQNETEHYFPILSRIVSYLSIKNIPRRFTLTAQRIDPVILYDQKFFLSSRLLLQ